MGREKRNTEGPDDQESFGQQFDISESDSTPGTENTEEHWWSHLGYIDRWDPIPSLKRLLKRLYPPRRPPAL